MKKKRNFSRVLAMLMGLALVLTMIPMVGSEVYADDPAPAAPGIALGSEVISYGPNTQGAATVHMANTTWRVIGYGGSGLASSANTMTLFATDNLQTGIQFNPNTNQTNTYKDSNLYNAVQNLTGASGIFSNGEKSGMATRNLAADSYTSTAPYTDGIEGEAVANALLWPLSTKEAYYLHGNLKKANDYWWLRSPGDAGARTAFVYNDGGIEHAGNNVSYNNGLRPAFNYNLSSILFTSAATGGKSSGSVGADALKVVGTNSNNEWKLTVQSGHDGFAVTTWNYDDTDYVLTVSYIGAVTNSGGNEYVSAVVVDKDGNITHYGNIKQCTNSGDASGQIEINLDGILSCTDARDVYIFNEQVNGNGKTDYASPLTKITISALGHSYGEPIYSWVKEGEDWKCIATRVCEKDTSHTETETVTATGAVKTAATCTEAGTSTYTATFTNTAFAKQTKDVDDIPATGHYYLWGYSNDEEHIGICDYCGDEITEEHEYTYGTCNICNGRCKHSSLSDSYSHNPDRHWKRCTYCMNVIEDEEHEWQTAWTADETNHWHDCTVCGEKKDEENHTWDEGKVTKEPTVDEEGETTYTCTVCKATKTEPIDKLTPEPEPQPEPEPTSIPYSNISGNGGAWTNGSKDALSFTFKRVENDGQTFDRFTGIEVDGKDVPEKDASGRVNYTAKSGSVIIELQPSYLETLSAGKHTLTVNFDDGSTTAEFTIKSAGAKQEKANQKTSKTTPKTGDESNILFWLLLMATACIEIVVANKKRRCQK